MSVQRTEERRRGGEEAFARGRDGPVYLSTDLETVAIKGVGGGAVSLLLYLWVVLPSSSWWM